MSAQKHDLGVRKRRRAELEAKNNPTQNSPEYWARRLVRRGLASTAILEASKPIRPRREFREVAA